MNFIGSCAAIFQNNLIAAGHDHIGKMNQVFMLKQTLWIPLPFLEHQRNSAACAGMVNAYSHYFSVVNQNLTA